MKFYTIFILTFMHATVWGIGVSVEFIEEPFIATQINSALRTSYAAKVESIMCRHIKDKIGTPNNPELIAPFNTIIEMYDKAYPLLSDDGWFSMTNANKEILIETLQKISFQFKGKTAEDECPDLFRFMFINAYFNCDYVNLNFGGHFRDSIFAHLLSHYFDPQPLTVLQSNNIDNHLKPNFTTFMACQLYLGQLLTPTEYRQSTGFIPKLDDFWKNTSLDPNETGARGIITRYIDLFSVTNADGYGSNLYRSALSPIHGMARLFPDYVPLLCLISLSDTLILKYAPDDVNNLWLVGCPHDRVTGDGGYTYPNVFITHDLHHLSTWAQATHTLSRCLCYIDPLKQNDPLDMIYEMCGKYRERVSAKCITSQRKAFYKALTYIKEWIDAKVDEDEQRLRAFCAFYVFHETMYPLQICNLDSNDYIEAKFTDLNVQNLRNPKYYQTLLPGKMQAIFNEASLDAPPSAEETTSLEMIKDKIKGMYKLILANHSLNESERNLIHMVATNFYYDSVYTAGFGNTKYPHVSHFDISSDDSRIAIFMNANGKSVHKCLWSTEKNKPLVTEERLAELADERYPDVYLKAPLTPNEKALSQAKPLEIPIKSTADHLEMSSECDVDMDKEAVPASPPCFGCIVS